jgi:hypothetical protein
MSSAYSSDFIHVMVSCALRRAGNDSITFKMFCGNCDNKTSMPNSDSVAWRYILACSDTVILANLDHLGIQHRISAPRLLSPPIFWSQQLSR